MNRFKNNIFILIVVLIPMSFWLWHFANDQWLESRDTMHMFYVLKRWSWIQLLNGDLPLWNPHMFTGFYQLASPALGVFSPFTAIFYTLFDNYLAEQLQLPLFAILGSLGAYYLARECGLAPSYGLLMGVAFSLSGFLLSLPDRSPFYYAYALYPLITLTVIRSARSNSLWHGLGFSFLLCLLLMNGDWVGAALFIAIYFLSYFYTNSTLLSRCWPLLLGIGLSAIAVLPVFENLSESTRAHGIPFTEASSFSFHPFRLINFVTPEFWGYANDRSFWGHNVSNAPFAPRFWFHSIYLGSAISVLGLLGWHSSPKKMRWSISAAFIFFLILSLGVPGYLHTFFYKFAPMYKNLRYPEKFLMLAGFIWFLSALLGIKYIYSTKKWTTLWTSIALWNIAALLILCFAPSEEKLIQIYNLLPESASVAQSHLASGRFVHTFGLLFAFVFLRVRAIQKFIPIGLIAITCIELLHFAPAMHWSQKKEFTEQGIFTSEIQQSSGRFLLDLRIMPYHDRKKFMLSNWPILDGLHDISGYETIMPLRLMSIREDQLYPHIDTWARVLNWTDIITVASPRAPSLIPHAEKGNLVPVSINSDLNLALLRWSAPASSVEFFNSVEKSDSHEMSLQKLIDRGLQKGSAIIEFDMEPFSSSITLESEWKKMTSRLTTVSYEIKVNTPALFVERAAYHPGWKATINGQPTPLLRIDSFSRGVAVTEGQHTITFTFHPPLFYISATISLISLILFIGLTLIAFKKSLWS